MSTTKIMATRSLDAMRELFSSSFKPPQKGYDFYSSIVEMLNNLETSGKDMLAEILKMQPTATPEDDIFLRLGVNMGFALVAIAFGLQAIREDSLEHAVESGYWHGVAVSMRPIGQYELSAFRTASGINANKARGKKYKATEYQLKQHWQDHINPTKRATDAAISLEKTDICKNADPKPRRSTLERYVRKWQALPK
jgi:hypothetical protein